MYNGEDIKKAQEERRENILKGFSGNDFEKAKSGVYEDTAENRRLGRVGNTYGTKKQMGRDHAEEVAAKVKRDSEAKSKKEASMQGWDDYKKSDDYKADAKKLKEFFKHSSNKDIDDKLQSYYEVGSVGKSYKKK